MEAVQITQITNDELRELFINLSEKITRLEAKIENAAAPTYMTEDEVCEWLQISRGTVLNLVNRGVITRYKLGRPARYELAQMISALEGTKYEKPLS